MQILGVLFDFDGTLTEPGSLDFGSIRDALRCPQGRAILEFIETLPSVEERLEAHEILDRFEIEAAGRSKANAGAEETLSFLRSCGLRLGIISRNSMRSILRTFENFTRLRTSDFDVIISRDDSLPPKPRPETVLAAAAKMGIPPAQLLMVGDFVFDIEAGRQAGAQTVFLTNRNPLAACSTLPDFTIGRLEELEGILGLFSPLPSGKLPNTLLSRFLDELDIGDPSLVVAPQVGEDVAAVRMQGEEILVLKSDPITFATDAMAFYAVVVNVNDIATSGAVPRWLTVSLLFPPGTSAAQIRKVMSELRSTSHKYGLILCGGHTEITDAVTRPVAVGHVVGTVSRRGLIEKRGLRQGNRILMTKAIALEGTCILAREIADRLQDLGIGVEEIARCGGFLYDPGISILPEARIAAASGGVTAMHDITEGGLATALEELSVAGRHRLRIIRDRIPMLEETRHICDALGIDPLGLIGSGSLLIACECEATEELARSIKAAGVDATIIGEVLEEGSGVEATDEQAERVSWPHFAVDEIARIFADRSRPRR